MAVYLIANIEVTDPAKFDEYRQKVAPLIAPFGGRDLVRGGDVRHLEGSLPIRRLVVLEFPTIEAAQRFYSAEYQPVLKIRLASTRSDVVLAPGYGDVTARLSVPGQERRFVRASATSGLPPEADIRLRCTK
jgi:uncharacterized protein (DUF1330 family)